MIIVVDASVALKWFLLDRPDEGDLEPAVKLLLAIRAGTHELLAPPHFVCEVAAVLARVTPEAARARLRDLLRMKMQIKSSETIHLRALGLADHYQHHLFDTLYHALALETPGAVLITADEAYWRKARAAGAIQRLGDFKLPA